MTIHRRTRVDPEQTSDGRMHVNCPHAFETLTGWDTSTPGVEEAFHAGCIRRVSMHRLETLVG